MRWETRMVHTGFLWGSLGERENFEDLDVNGMIILKWNLKKSVAKAWTVLVWLRIRTSG